MANVFYSVQLHFKPRNKYVMWWYWRTLLPVIRALHTTFSNSDIKAVETTEGVREWPSTSVLLISRNLFIKHVSSTAVCTRTTHSGTPHLHFRHRVYLYRPCIYRPAREEPSTSEDNFSQKHTETEFFHALWKNLLADKLSKTNGCQHVILLCSPCF